LNDHKQNNDNNHQDNLDQIMNYECNIDYLFNIDTHKTSKISNIISKDSYNLILTTSYMMIIPRSRKAFHFNKINNNDINYNYSSSSSNYDDEIINDDNKDVIEINSLGFLGLFLLKQFKHVQHLQQLSLFDVLFSVSRKIY
jgi:ATP adenylyltransferase/5',5'''-P-1,P-4-tetraphosphate phosphorylase II